MGRKQNAVTSKHRNHNRLSPPQILTMTRSYEIGDKESANSSLFVEKPKLRSPDQVDDDQMKAPEDDLNSHSIASTEK
jgi:hypothetical protein